ARDLRGPASRLRRSRGCAPRGCCAGRSADLRPPCRFPAARAARPPPPVAAGLVDGARRRADHPRVGLGARALAPGARRPAAAGAPPGRRGSPRRRTCAPAGARATSWEVDDLALAGLAQAELPSSDLGDPVRITQRGELDLELALLVLETELHLPCQREVVA